MGHSSGHGLQQDGKGTILVVSPVATFLHEVLNSGAIVKYLSGKSNAAADYNSRNAAACKDPEKCQICIWVADKENMVVRRAAAKSVESILAGNDPLPFKSKGYWAKRQREDLVLQKVARCIQKGIKPPTTKANGWPEAKQYLQKSNGVFMKGGVLMAPSVQAFSDTERFVVPKSAGMTVVSIYHQQFDCLKTTALKNLLRRNFLILNLDDLVHKCIRACYNCAATRDEKHIQAPMSSVTPPETFGEQFATDIIDREKQKIITLRETATSHTWAKFVKNETAEELENGLRCLFALVGPSNATRARICRTDNAKSFISLHNNQSLTDIGVTIDLSNAQNKNGNPVAEKNNREVQDAILGITPAGGQISEVELSEAISALNSKPRWTGMSAS